MSISSRLNQLKTELPEQVRLVAVSKFHEATVIREAYDAGQRLFGESRVQELLPKYEQLPQDIEWHFIGHLQLNKVKQIAPFIDTVQSVDSVKLLEELNRQAGKFNRKIKVLLQVHIAREEHKFGFSFDEMADLLPSGIQEQLTHVTITGLMGMATFTDDKEQIREEFASLSAFFSKVKKQYFAGNTHFNELSMGMSDDYPIAIEEGSTMIRVGTKIFGPRNY
ncbi:YggS family pyridoxal phosphate enzyme [Bacteroidia bacterium]|nr:YggS family pyridoxal phosphate enzyme [Bacteroidia bacterium]GHT05023.1 YggS family pyridoxal phosphate enzyme [Bacteroidia bacterium]GHT48250.1 YggS family pyridoxal phosphate enzyme [Bacteroidia bacterium]